MIAWLRKHSVECFVFLGMLAACCCGLYGAEIVRINGRFALFVGEMKQYGIGVFPTLYNKPYTDYPSTLVFLMYLTSLGGNVINMLTLAFPTALASAWAALFTYKIGETVSRRTGILSVFFLPLAFDFLSMSSAPGLDIFVTAATVTLFWALRKLDDGASRAYFLVPILAVLFSFTVRGPMGILVPSAVWIAFYAVARRWKLMILAGFLAGLTSIVAMVIFMELTYLQGGRELLYLFFHDQILSRFGSSRPFHYFVTNAMGSFAITYPLALIILVVMACKFFQAPAENDSPAIKLGRELAGWIIIVIIGFSIPGTKHLRYITPIIPAMALLCGLWLTGGFSNIFLDKLHKLFIRIASLAAPVLFVASLLAAVILPFILPFVLPGVNLPIGILVLLFGLLSWGIIVCVPQYLGAMQKSRRELFEVFTLAVATVVIHGYLVLPIESAVESSRAFSAEITKAREGKQLVYYNFGPDGDELKYLLNLPLEERFIGEYVIIREEESQPEQSEEQFLQTWVEKLIALFPEDIHTENPPLLPRYKIAEEYQALFEYPEDTFFLTREKYFNRTPEAIRNAFDVVVKGDLGHQECLVFRRKPGATMPELQ